MLKGREEKKNFELKFETGKPKNVIGQYPKNGCVRHLSLSTCVCVYILCMCISSCQKERKDSRLQWCRKLLPDSNGPEDPGTCLVRLGFSLYKLKTLPMYSTRILFVREYFFFFFLYKKYLYCTRILTIQKKQRLVRPCPHLFHHSHPFFVSSLIFLFFVYTYIYRYINFLFLPLLLHFGLSSVFIV